MDFEKQHTQKVKNYSDFLRKLYYTINKDKPINLGDLFDYLNLDSQEMKELYQEIKNLGLTEYRREAKRRYRNNKKVKQKWKY